MIAELMIFLSLLTDIAAAVFSHPVALLVYGLATHFLKALVEIKKHTGTNVTLRQYYLANPAQSLLAMFGAGAGYVILIPNTPPADTDTYRLVLAMAFTIGYMADSMVDVIGQRSGLRQPTPNKEGP